MLLVGPCDGGKTMLFHQLLEGSTHLGTVASMQSNVAEGVLASEKVRRWVWGKPLGCRGCSAKWKRACSARARRDRPVRCSSLFWHLLQGAGGAARKPFQLVDIPGHPRVRGQVDRHADRAAGVVFVVDSVDFMPRKTEAAE